MRRVCVFLLFTTTYCNTKLVLPGAGQEAGATAGADTRTLELYCKYGMKKYYHVLIFWSNLPVTRQE